MEAGVGILVAAVGEAGGHCGEVSTMVLVPEALVVVPPLRMTLPDPVDLPFLKVAVASGDDALVTGNIRHFEKWRLRSLPVETPAEFLERLVGTSD